MDLRPVLPTGDGMLEGMGFRFFDTSANEKGPSCAPSAHANGLRWRAIPQRNTLRLCFYTFCIP